MPISKKRYNAKIVGIMIDGYPNARTSRKRKPVQELNVHLISYVHDYHKDLATLLAEVKYEGGGPVVQLTLTIPEDKSWKVRVIRKNWKDLNERVVHNEG